MLLFVAGLASIIYLGLTAQPTSTVVLLPDADGGVGSVEIRSDSSARQSLASPYSNASITTRGDIVSRVDDAGQVLQRYAQTLSVRPKAPVSFMLLFEFGSAVDIAPAFKPVLNQLLAAIADFPSPQITVIGHTDRVGSQADNDRLSLERAETVRRLLIDAGIQPAIVSIAGRGEREPAVPTPDDVAMPENRRVEINLR